MLSKFIVYFPQRCVGACTVDLPCDVFLRVVLINVFTVQYQSV